MSGEMKARGEVDGGVWQRSEITVPLEHGTSLRLRLHERIASAEVDGEKFQFSVGVGSGPLMFSVGPRQYEIPVRELCAAVIAFDRAQNAAVTSFVTERGS